MKHAIAYTLDAANDQKLAAEYADGKKLFRVGLFTNARRQKLYNRLGVVFEKPLGGDGLFSDEILGVAAIRPGMTLQNVMANTRQVVRQISKEVLAPPA